MSSLFSTFDPQSWFNLHLNWTLLFLLVIAGYASLSLNAPSKSIRTTILINVRTEFEAAAAGTAAKGCLIPILALFFTIFMLNVPGLLPYSFTLSSHLRATVALALPLWLGHILLGLLRVPSTLLSHIVPLGAPGVLIPFIVLIELVRNIIRPLTLSVRLAANIIAGHLLISLLGQAIFPAISGVLCLCLGTMLLLCILESGVSVIQAYVLSLLSSLYVNEIQTNAL